MVTIIDNRVNGPNEDPTNGTIKVQDSARKKEIDVNKKSGKMSTNIVATPIQVIASKEPGRGYKPVPAYPQRAHGCKEELDTCIQQGLTKSEIEQDCDELEAALIETVNQLEALPSISSRYSNSDQILGSSTKQPVPSMIKAPELELKQLLEHLKYAYLGEHETLPCIIASDLSSDEESKLLRVLKDHKTALGWSIADIKGIGPTMCMHRILLVEESKPTRESQRRLNPHMKEVVRAEVLKLLDVGIIYPISGSKWVSPVQVVPAK
ncbi:hypothetical protein AAC387_Pa09g0871 [Persea americana]